MSSREQAAEQKDVRGAIVAYEPPCVERTLGPAELEREVLYAGDETTGDEFTL